jgi:hypothetical protein
MATAHPGVLSLNALNMLSIFLLMVSGNAWAFASHDPAKKIAI